MTIPSSLAAAGEVSSVQVRSRRIGFECASGDWIEDDWTGVPLADLVDAASMPETTTHVRVESADGYCACIPMVDLMGSLVALDAVERPASDFPRFVSSSVGGPRALKHVVAVEPLALDAGENREDYEELWFEED
ncbi:molybdopterin-dependent oxidoreductase [Haloarculaceae archaeon H-GB2-1]|nr:molybdopterin-dependent oxidoreductase [Haloarculaceae archaeon H-GB11]MEA5408367.1 molybdopterin-dependent oxidoreductase [Haloarculaceae archaeon H-GB2-1]